MNNTFLDYCKIHGDVDHRFVKRKGSNDRKICIKCRSEAVQRRRLKLKKMALEYKGGCCSICGYNKCDAALEFHHIDPSQKDFGISENGHTKSFDKIKVELDKCILVCSNCHQELHHPDKINISIV